MFGASPAVAAATSVTFVAPVALESGALDDLGARLTARRGARHASLAKADMVENDALPDVRVDADTFAVTIDGELVEAEPVSELPMAQRYFLF